MRRSTGFSMVGCGLPGVFISRGVCYLWEYFFMCTGVGEYIVYWWFFRFFIYFGVI